MTPVIFDGMAGLGDNIYQRPFLRHYPGAYLRTPWPEIYKGLDVKCIRTGTQLRTQRKNEIHTDYQFFDEPANARRVRIGYGQKDMAAGGIVDAFRRQFGVSGSLQFDLPSFSDFHKKIPFSRRLAVIRPATVRSEWASASRNPDPVYLNAAAAALKKSGFYVISIADLEKGAEWMVGEAPQADLVLHGGELSLAQLCTLYENAACVVSPVGFSLPMAIAYRTPLFVIAGGRGGHNAPEIVTDPAMPLDNVRWAIPKNYCRCIDASHACDKAIDSFDKKINGWLNEIVK